METGQVEEERRRRNIGGRRERTEGKLRKEGVR